MRDGAALLASGVCGLAFYAVYTRVWTSIRIALDSPEWMDKSPIGAFASLLLLMSLMAILFAPGTTAGIVPKRNLIYWVGAGFLGGLFVGLLIWVVLAKNTPEIPVSIVQALQCDDPKPVFVKAYCRAMPTRDQQNGYRP